MEIFGNIWGQFREQNSRLRANQEANDVFHNRQEARTRKLQALIHQLTNPLPTSPPINQQGSTSKPTSLRSTSPQPTTGQALPAAEAPTYSPTDVIECLQQMNKDAELNLDPELIATSSSLLESYRVWHLIALMLWLFKGSPPGTRYSSILDTDEDPRWVLCKVPQEEVSCLRERWALTVKTLKDACKR
jgi:hypothetical protein